MLSHDEVCKKAFWVLRALKNFVKHLKLKGPVPRSHAMPIKAIPLPKHALLFLDIKTVVNVSSNTNLRYKPTEIIYQSFQYTP